jgi:hypothetical protein
MALQTAQTKTFASRYNEGRKALVPFEVLYLAEDHLAALFEVRAIVGDPYLRSGAVQLPNPRHAWIILNVRVQLREVADLTRVSQQKLIETTAQELTGDWEGYEERQPGDSVNQPTGTAPTQDLGQALYSTPGLEGFRTISARHPSRMLLVVFPEKLHQGSQITFEDTAGGRTHTIKPATRRRRRTR